MARKTCKDPGKRTGRRQRCRIWGWLWCRRRCRWWRRWRSRRRRRCRRRCCRWQWCWRCRRRRRWRLRVVDLVAPRLGADFLTVAVNERRSVTQAESQRAHSRHGAVRAERQAHPRADTPPATARQRAINERDTRGAHARETHLRKFGDRTQALQLLPLHWERTAATNRAASTTSIDFFDLSGGAMTVRRANRQQRWLTRRRVANGGRARAAAVVVGRPAGARWLAVVGALPRARDRDRRRPRFLSSRCSSPLRTRSARACRRRRVATASATRIRRRLMATRLPSRAEARRCVWCAR